MKTTVTAEAAMITVIESENGWLTVRLNIDHKRQQQVRIEFADAGLPGIIGPDIVLTQEQILRPIIVRAEMDAHRKEAKFKIGDVVRCLRKIEFSDGSVHRHYSKHIVDETTIAYYNTPCNSVSYEVVNAE